MRTSDELLRTSTVYAREAEAWRVVGQYAMARRMIVEHVDLRAFARGLAKREQVRALSKQEKKP